MVQQQNLARLQQAVSAVDTVLNELKHGELKVEVFKYLQNQQHAILELCQISEKYGRKEVEKLLREKREELDMYRKFVDDANRFWSIFRFSVDIKGLFSTLSSI